MNDVLKCISVSVMLKTLVLCCSGNFEGEKPYQTGTEACTGCPSDRQYCVNNLCSCTQVLIFLYIPQFFLVFLFAVESGGAGAAAVSLLAIVMMTVTSALLH